MTPAQRIATALAIWPGREVDVAAEAGVSKSRLRVWAGLGVGRYMAPTDSDADLVEQAVKALLVARLHELAGATMQLPPAQ